jgi:thiamine biosynthesis lipoprotein
VLDETQHTVSKVDPEVQVDLSAIAKGYAVDQISEMLTELGHPSHMVEIGGEVRVGEAKPDGSAWRIGIERPDVGAEGLQRLVPLVGMAMASSGNYRNFYVMDGRVVGHTIDPRTARPVDHEGASVSVVAAECGFADAAATVMMVMGPQEGLRWAEEHEIAALFVVHEDGAFVERMTREFRRIVDTDVQ